MKIILWSLFILICIIPISYAINGFGYDSDMFSSYTRNINYFNITNGTGSVNCTTGFVLQNISIQNDGMSGDCTAYSDGGNLSYVPYTGALYNVNLGNKNLSAGGISVTDGTYNVNITGTTIYSNTAYNPFMQLGLNSAATGSYSMAVGLTSVANASHSIALGSSAHAYGTEGVAIGTSTTARYRAIALGYQSYAFGDGASALGNSAGAYGDYSVAIGNQVQAHGDYSLAMLQHAKTYGLYSVSIGISTNASGWNSYAFGDNVTVAGTRSYGFGEDGLSTDDNTFTLHNLDLVVDGNITGNQIYGGIHYHNHTGTLLTFGTANRYYYFFMDNADFLNGFTANNIGQGKNSSLTAQFAGVYQAVYSAVGDGENNDIYIVGVFVNETQIESCDSHKKLEAGGDILTMNGNCFIKLNVGDNVSLRIENDGGTGTGNYYGSNLNLVRVGN